MKLDSVWVVREPGPESRIVDVVFEASFPFLRNYMIGAGPAGTWERENHTVYTERDEALKDAIGRMMGAHPDAAPDMFLDEAHDAFGYEAG